MCDAMKIKKIPNKNLRSIVSFEIANGRIFGLTGRRLIELDPDLNRIAEYDGFSYTYKAKLSPDKKYLLCVSVCNIFYLLNLETGEIEKNTVRGKYGGNLEGRGCWSFDGKFVYLPVFSQKNFISALRKYSVEDGSFVDLFADKWKIFDIVRVQSLKKILMLVSDDNARHSFVWFDEKTETVREISLPEGVNSLNMSVDERTRTITVYNFFETPVVFDFNGKAVCGFVEIRKKKRFLPRRSLNPQASDSKDIAEIKQLFEEIKAERNAADAVSDFEDEAESEFPEPVISENSELPEDTMSATDDEEDGLFFVGTRMSLLVWDRNNLDDRAEIPVEFGVQKIERIGKNRVLAAGMSSVSLYEVVR